MIVVKKFVFNSFSENTFVIWDEDTSETMIVDPGCSNVEEEIELTSFIEERDLTVSYLINTHCHIDHILGCKFIKDKYNPSYLAPREDIPLLQHASQQAAVFGMEIKYPPMPDQYLTEYSEVKLGSNQARFLFTPGHTPGEYCIYFEEQQFCISGDVLFHRSIGRTDLWGGDYDLLIKSIEEKLMTLPDEVIIYPGHGANTNIGEERKENPFLRGK